MRSCVETDFAGRHRPVKSTRTSACDNLSMIDDSRGVVDDVEDIESGLGLLLERLDIASSGVFKSGVDFSRR